MWEEQLALKSHIAPMHYFPFSILPVQKELWGLVEGNELKTLCSDEFFISIVAWNATLRVLHKQVKVVLNSKMH